jgi:hypothetical protein
LVLQASKEQLVQQDLREMPDLLDLKVIKVR